MSRFVTGQRRMRVRPSPTDNLSAQFVAVMIFFYIIIQFFRYTDINSRFYLTVRTYYHLNKKKIEIRNSSLLVTYPIRFDCCNFANAPECRPMKI